MKFINTIELEPFSYATLERQYPNGGVEEMPDQWNHYWTACLSDSNLGHLIAVEKGSWFVPINQLDESALVEILKLELEEVDLEEFEDQVGPICGGIVLQENGETLLTPSCCGDLANIREWQDIPKSKPDTWHPLWVGHPWPFYKRTGDFITFSSKYESNLADIGTVEEVFNIGEATLIAGLRQVDQELLEIKSLIAKTLHNMGIANAERIAEIMTGLGKEA